MKARKHFIASLSLAIMLPFAMTGCGNTSNAEEISQTAAPVASTSVETQILSEGSIQEYKTISSSILAENEVSVIPKVSGTVTKVNFSVGDHVKAGDILFEIDSTDLQIQLKSAQSSVSSSQASVSSAEAGLNSAKANYDMTTGSNLETQISSQKTNVENLERQYNDLVRDLESNKTLLEAGAVSQNTIDNLETQVATAKANLDHAKEQLETLQNQTVEETKRVSQASIEQAQASVNQAQASVNQAQASVESSKQQLSYTKVKAEIDGIVSSCNVTEGSMATSASPAMTIINIDQVKIAFNVTGDVVNDIHVGDTVYTSVDAVSSEAFEAVVSTVAPAADNKTGLYPVEIQINNPDYLLKPGMFAISKLVFNQKENIISVPLNAVIEKNDEKYVFTVDSSNIAHKVVVETGIENDTDIEIVSGLNSSDIVVVKGQDYLSDGSLVNIVASNE